MKEHALHSDRHGDENENGYNSNDSLGFTTLEEECDMTETSSIASSIVNCDDLFSLPVTAKLELYQYIPPYIMIFLPCIVTMVFVLFIADENTFLTITAAIKKILETFIKELFSGIAFHFGAIGLGLYAYRRSDPRQSTAPPMLRVDIYLEGHISLEN